MTPSADPLLLHLAAGQLSPASQQPDSLTASFEKLGLHYSQNVSPAQTIVTGVHKACQLRLLRQVSLEVMPCLGQARLLSLGTPLTVAVAVSKHDRPAQASTALAQWVDARSQLPVPGALWQANTVLSAAPCLTATALQACQEQYGCQVPGH